MTTALSNFVCFPTAKINLGLRVLDKRADGYHNIESILLPLPFLFDVLEGHLSPTSECHVYHNRVLAAQADNNLCSKLLRFLTDNFSLPPFNIHLLKAVPVGAGLGGGSSDVAFLLKTLVRNNFLSLNDTQALEILSKFGADCTFFYHNEMALATGIGHTLAPVPLNLDTYNILVVDGQVNISTQWAYKALASVRTPSKTNSSLLSIVQQPIYTWKDALYNDFESVIFRHYPALSALKIHLYDIGAVYASLSGTGGAVYAIFDKKENYLERLKLPKTYRKFYSFPQTCT